MDIENLLQGIQSIKNDERQRAELELLQLCSSDPASTFLHLINISSNQIYTLSIRQMALLCIRKFITMYWSAGFSSYVGPPGVGEAVKTQVREGLLNILMNNTDSENKIPASCIYCIVQICAVDFPDEWPNLIDDLSEVILKRESVHGAKLLTELVEEVMTNDMFFQKEIGEKLLLLVSMVVGGSFQFELKLNVLKLYEQCLVHLGSSFYHTSMAENNWVTNHYDFINTVFDNLLKDNSSELDSDSIVLKSEVFRCLGKLAHIVPKAKQNLVNLPLRMEVWALLMKGCSQFYDSVLNQEDSSFIPIQESAINLIEYVQALEPSQLEPLPAMEIAEYMEILCSLPDDPYDDYNFNEFASKETGLSASYTVRDELGQFFSTISGQFHSQLVHFVINSCLQMRTKAHSRQEALLFMLQELSSNDLCMNITHPQEFVRLFDLILSDDSSIALVKSRLLLVIPKFFENNMEIIPNIRELVKEFIEKSFRRCISSQNMFLISSMMIAFTYYASFTDLASVLDENTSTFVQTSLLQGIEMLSMDSEEDSMGLLLECLHETLKIWSVEQNLGIKRYELQVVLKLSSKEPSNVRIVIESVRCLSLILKNLAENEYLQMCEVCIPSFLTVLESYISTSQNYSPLVTLTLDLLGVFMKTPPTQGVIPDSIAEKVVLDLVQFIQSCKDEDILANALETFNYLVFNCSPTYAQENTRIVLSIIFSSEKQFIHHLDVGPLILLVLKFNKDLQMDILNEILAHTVPKVLEKEMNSVAKNYMLIICELLLLNFTHALEFISSYKSSGTENVMNTVVANLFDIFETDRNDEMIKEVILALNAMFFSCDARIPDLYFDTEYENKIPFKEKVIKLYAGELVAHIDSDKENRSDISSNFSDFDSFEDKNEDIILFLGRSIDFSIKELMEEFFVQVNGQSRDLLGAVFPILSTQEQFVISTILMDRNS